MRKWRVHHTYTSLNPSGQEMIHVISSDHLMPYKEAVALRKELKKNPKIETIEIEDEHQFNVHLWRRE